MTLRLHIEKIEAKAFRTFIRLCSLFKIERLSSNIKLTLHKALIRSELSYACPAWEFAAENHLLKLQRLQNKVLRTIGRFPRRTSVRDMHVPFQIPYVYDYITKSVSMQKSYNFVKMKMFDILDKVKPNMGNTKGLNLAEVMFTTVQVFRLPL
jgi:hypothetical protein